MEFPEWIKPCPQGVAELEFEVTEKQIDAYGKMRVSDLARQMEKITEAHLASFGVDYLSLKEEGKAWVIAWTSIHIARLPKEGEKVILRMWPGKNKVVMYSRQYAFFSGQGEPLAAASSLFLLMDLNTRSATGPTEKLKQIPVISLPGEMSLPNMRETMPSELGKEMRRVVQPTEIDKNGHMNNTCYLDWMDDIRENEDMGDLTPSYVWVQYQKELREGQEAVLSYDTNAQSLSLIGKGEEESFCMKVLFQI